MLVSNSAFAQSEEEAYADPVMEEIIVTSRKREERLLDVPDQITVFTAIDIAQAGIDNIYDAALLTPGVYFSGDWSPTVNTITIRGISNNPNGDAPIAYVVDNVVYGNSFLISQDFYDVEQIEIMKGPQGALYGKGSTAGVISIRTHMPTNELETRGKLRVANGNEYLFNGSVSGAIVEDKVLFGLTALLSDYDGEIKNVFHDVTVDFRKQVGVRGRLVFTPNDDLSIDLRASYYDAEHAGTRWKATNVSPALGIITEGIQNDFLTEGTTTVKDFAAEINWDFGAATLTSITDFQDMDIPRSIDLDFVELSLLEAAIDPEDAEIFTQELRLTSNGDGPFRWLVGSFYQKQERYREISVWLNVSGGDLDPDDKVLLQVFHAPNELSNRVTAMFVQGSYDFNDQWELTVGLRHDSDNRKDILADLQETFSDLQPKVTLAYKPNSNWMLYGTYSEGFRSGGFNSNDVFGRRFDQEELKNYEFGFKGLLADGNLGLEGAVYTMDFSNQQFFLFADGSQALVNVDKSKIKGLELVAHWTPMERLNIDLGGSLIDATLSELGAFPGPVTGDEVNGNDLPFVPDYNYNVSVQYQTAEFENGMSLIARMDWVRYGRIWWTITNLEEQSQKPYSLLNLRLSLVRDNWRLTGFVDNATDTEYDTFCFSHDFISSPFGVDPCFDGTPRRYGIELSKDF
jgi:iron complex outermembrane receptor protein